MTSRRAQAAHVPAARRGGGSTAADETFRDQVRGATEPDADVVVVCGSRNDTFLPVADVRSQAAAVYGLGRRRAAG